MRMSPFIGTLISALLGSQVALADEEPLRIGVDIPYAPYQYKLPDGTITGFEVELIEAGDGALG